MTWFIDEYSTAEPPRLGCSNNFEVHRFYKRRKNCVYGELDKIVTITGGVHGEPLGITEPQESVKIY